MLNIEKPLKKENVDCNKENFEIKAKNKATKIKIYIKSEGKTVINLPAISLSFIAMLGNVGIKLALKIASLDPEKKDLKKVIEASEEFDIGIIIRELQNHEPFDLVYVKNEKDKTEIIIRTQ